MLKSDAEANHVPPLTFGFAVLASHPVDREPAWVTRNFLSGLLFVLRVGVEIAWARFGSTPGTMPCRSPVVHRLRWITLSGVAVQLGVANFASAWRWRWRTSVVVALLPKCAG